MEHSGFSMALELIRPSRNIANKEPIEQVVKQVHDLSSEINQQLLNIPSHKIFEINISNLRNQPIFTVSRIGKFLDAEPASNAPRQN